VSSSRTRPPDEDDLFDPAASHGSDLDPRIDSDQDQPEQTLGADEAGPDRSGRPPE
jgi:hypothetical protein